MKNKNIFFGVVLLIIIALVISIKVSSAQQTTQTSLDSSDAIGVRIVPNPEHYSIARWYKNQGFSGSPQSLTVDGYEAIRDGRTVYVNAANIKIDPDNPNNRLIYTNIYLISYNQDPSAKTIDILGQIIKNWKFNADLSEDSFTSATCSISTIVCASDGDCSSNEFCAPASSAQANTCQLKEARNCFFDADCPKGFFCDSVKAKVIRDVKRAGQAVEITEALNRYYSSFGSYPKLSAGSYLSGQTLSLWPSWSANFLKELSLPANFVDPINRLGYCPGFDKATCWSASSSRFYVPSGTTAGTSIVLPANSFAYAYRLNEGKAFSFCSTLETAVNKTGLNFQFSPPAVAGSCIVDGLPNTSPRFVSAQLEGETGKEFVGWVEFVDDQDNLMTWDINYIGRNWEKDKEKTWGTNPELFNTNNSNQKKIYAPKAPSPGNYRIRLIVSDGQATTATDLNIVISSAKPFIEAENAFYNLSANQPLTYSFHFSDDNLSDYKTAFKIKSLPDSTNNQSPSISSAPSNFKTSIDQAGLNRYKVTYELPLAGLSFDRDRTYNYEITVTNKYNSVASKNVALRIYNEPPFLSFSCLNEARIGGAYSCLLGPKKQVGAGNQDLQYTLSTNFTNLQIEEGIDPNNVILKADRAFANNNVATGTIKIKAVNEYGAYSEKDLFLKFNTYCGDGIKQMPNNEKRGGIYNDGYEDCDGVDGVATGNNRVASSSISRQYACATFDANTPYPIPNNGFCVYKSPISGGGFCGDGYCQVKDEQGNNLESYENCSQDCLHLCQPNCTNKSCGDDGCGGSCGSCSVIGEECYGGACCSTQGTVSVFLFDDPVIMGGTEGAPSIFFNDKKYQLSRASADTYTTKVPVEHGKNVLAVDAQIKNFTNGINVSLNHCSRQPISPGNIQNVKCINPVASLKDVWYKKDYNDTAWPQANLGYYQGRVSVWANDYDSSHSRLLNAYCRYTFNGDDTSGTNCVPDPSNKECGATPCGGYYRPDDCVAVNDKNTNFYCATSQCACSIQSCADKNGAAGVSTGAEGSVCGPNFDNNCNGKLDCDYSCGEGLFCNLPFSSSINQGSDGMKARNYLQKKGKIGDLGFLINSCGAGKPLNTCQKKCWINTSFEISTVVRQGDIPSVNTCSVEKVDKPRCTDNPNPSCPTQCPNKSLITLTSSNDSCWKQNAFSSTFGFWYTWTTRNAWLCSAKTATKTWYYNDTCFSNGNWKVRSDGTCGPCLSQCDGKKCGDDDGCGGVCQVETCGANQRCTTSGTCENCSSCSEVLCGEKNNCGVTCSSQGVCEQEGSSCQGGTCVLNTYTLKYNTTGSGSVTGETQQLVTHGSCGKSVLAVPASGYTFNNWTDNSTSNPRTDCNVSSNISVAATFKTCVPNCAGKVCGDNGCGGSCGTCGYLSECTNGQCQCKESSAGKVIISADDKHTAYFNGVKIGSAENIAAHEYLVNISNGKNVLAVQVVDTGVQWGLAAAIQDMRRTKLADFVNTDTITGWKCIDNSKIGRVDWFMVNFDDSTWPEAVEAKNSCKNCNSNKTSYQQLWAATVNNKAKNTVVCRYTFTKDFCCTPNCSGKQCGASDSCNGFCYGNCGRR